MTITQFIGYLLLAAPFIGIAWFCFATNGWQMFLFVFGGTALMVGLLAFGIYLIDGKITL